MRSTRDLADQLSRMKTPEIEDFFRELVRSLGTREEAALRSIVSAEFSLIDPVEGLDLEHAE